MSKRAKKSTVETMQLVERPYVDDPAVSRACELSDRWARRVQASSGSLQDVQHTLQQMATALQAFERERRGAEVQAVYLAALNIQGLLEYRLNKENGGDGAGLSTRGRGASLVNRKSSSRPPSSTRRPGSGAKRTAGSEDVVATLLSAASAAASDPKRKQRCVSALQQYFKMPYVDLDVADITLAQLELPAADGNSEAASPHSTVDSAGGGPAVEQCAPQEDSAGLRPPSASMGTVGSTQALSLQSGDGANVASGSAGGGGGGGGGGHPRRPREVPSPLWDEMTQLRCTYYIANEKVTRLAKAITAQLQRFALVRDNNEVACYAMEAVQVELKSATAKATEAAAARQQAEAAAALAESKARGTSAGSKRAKKS